MKRRRKPVMRFTGRFIVRCPASLVDAVERAAEKNIMTPSEYIRRCVIDRLKADGVKIGGGDAV